MAAVDEAIRRRASDARDIASRLDPVGPGLAAAYRGAMRAVRGRGDDWARHAAISLRELLDALLVQVAPEPAVCAWHASPEGPRDVPLREGSSKKLTRAARLAYVFRDVGVGAYAVFVGHETKLIQQTNRRQAAGPDSGGGARGGEARRAVERGHVEAP